MFKNYLMLLLILSATSLINAQSNFTQLFETEIGLEYNASSKYVHGFEIENRNIFYEDSKYDYQVRHLELAYTLGYVLSKNQLIVLGVQYRFKENFETSEENEFRTLQAFEWEQEKLDVSIKQKMRTEQRFYASTTKHRIRYELGFMFPLNHTKEDMDSTKKHTTYIKTETETLFEVAKTQKPEFEQRLSTSFGWQFAPKTEFEISLQYRVGDYTQDLKHELFFGTSVNIQL